MAVGAAQVITLGTDLVVGAAPAERAGAASAISETGLELGGALGIALLGSIGTAVYRSEAGSETFAGAVGTIDTATQAFAHGMQLAAVASAILMVAIAALAWRLLRERTDASATPVAAVALEPSA
jgi:DHA2 family multidrug resistance protein-like MFS transporter